MAAVEQGNPGRGRRRITHVKIKPPAGRYIVRGIVTGLLAAAVALGVAQLVAGITGPVGSPVVSVGQAVIGLTPRPVTDFVIKVFGPHDKPVLLITIVVLLALSAAAFGIATMRRPAAGFVGLGVFAVIGLVAVATRPNSAPADVIPTLAGAAVGAWALTRLARAAGAAGETQTARPAGRPARRGRPHANPWQPAAGNHG